MDKMTNEELVTKEYGAEIIARVQELEEVITNSNFHIIKLDTAKLVAELRVQELERTLSDQTLDLNKCWAKKNELEAENKVIHEYNLSLQTENVRLQEDSDFFRLNLNSKTSKCGDLEAENLKLKEELRLYKELLAASYKYIPLVEGGNDNNK